MKSSHRVLALIVIVTILFIAAIFSTLALLQRSANLTNSATTVTNTTVITRAVHNRSIVAHVGVPVVLKKYNIEVTLQHCTIDDTTLTCSVTVASTSDAAATPNLLTFTAPDQTQQAQNVNIRLVDATSSSAQFVISQ